MITESQFRGGADYVTAPSGAQDVYGRVLRFAPASNVFLDMPDATRFRTGGIYCIVINHGPSTVTIRDNEMNTVVVVASGTNVVVGLLEAGTPAGTWGTFIMRATPKTMGVWSGRDAVTSSSSTPATPVDCNAPAYVLTPCSGESDQTLIYTDTDLSADTGKIVKISGDDRCFTIAEADGRRVAAVSVTIDTEFENCRDCRKIFQLTDCAGVAATKYTDMDLSDYDGLVIRFSGGSSGSSLCWLVEEILFTGQALEVVPFTVDCSFTTCDCCLSPRQASGHCLCIREDSIVVVTWSATPAPGCATEYNFDLMHGGGAVGVYDTWNGSGTNVIFIAYVGRAADNPPGTEIHWWWSIGFDNATQRWSAAFVETNSSTWGGSGSVLANYAITLNGDCSGSTGIYSWVNDCLGGSGQDGPMSMTIRVQTCRDNDTTEPEGV